MAALFIHSLRAGCGLCCPVLGVECTRAGIGSRDPHHLLLSLGRSVGRCVRRRKTPSAGDDDSSCPRIQ
uniref:Putative secreted protein n=1 Tax=Anopheles triannulatus TaxID=58253 RepID=A0A2M4B7S8_9DIPT